MPLAAPRSGNGPTAAELATATCAAIAEHPTGRNADALAAYVRAWCQHWPSSFAAAFGARGTAVLAWADANVGDANRYLELRRIALENLAHVL